MRLVKNTDFELALCARLSGMIREIGEQRDIEGPITKHAEEMTKRVSIMRLNSFVFGIFIGIVFTTLMTLIFFI